jgi:hypothetical protein
MDAKNSDFDAGRAYPYREPMDSYISSAKTNHGILLFSKSNSHSGNALQEMNRKLYGLA